MRNFLSVMVLCSTLISGNALAHGDHGVISGQAAMNIATKSVKQMAFKDFGFEVGQLDESWKAIKDADVKVADVQADYFVVSATNAAQQKTIYFQIANNGQVLNVKNGSKFK